MSESTDVIDHRIMAMLQEAIFVRVATVTPRGRPHVAPFWFSCDGARIVISTLHNQTVRNLRARPDVAVLVDLGLDFRDLRGAQIRGSVNLHRADGDVPSAVQTCIEEIERAHHDELDEPEFERYEEWEVRPPIYVEVVPESATWFDLGQSEAGRTGRRAGPILG